jgi:hypothetical protein
VQGLRRRVRAVARGRGRRVGPGLPRRILSSGRRGREPGARRHDVRSACDSERPTTATHGQSWSLDGCGYESAWSAFALVRALETCPKLVVRGRIELPTFRFQAASSAAFWRRAAQRLSPQARSIVSLLVSFSYVRPGSLRHSRPCHRRSQTATTHGEHEPTDLESVLGATPREFESRILRHADQALCRGLPRVSVVTLRVWSQLWFTRKAP